MIISKELYEKVKGITLTNYKTYITKNEDEFYVDSEGILCMIEDLIYEIDMQQEKYEDMEEYFKQHYVYCPEPDPDIER